MSRWDRRKDSDDGSIIGYEPKFTFNKDGHIIKDESAREILENMAETDSTSETLKNFRESTPSKTIESFSLTKSAINDAISDLADLFDGGNWNKYADISTLLQAISTKDDDYINKFIEYHSDSITGSSIPEIIGGLYEENKRLDLFNDTSNRIFFGDDFFTDEEIKSMNESSYKTLLSFDSNSPEKINYMAVSFDSQYCKAMELHSVEIRKRALESTEILDSIGYNTSGSLKKSGIKNMFDDLLKKEKWRKSQYSSQQTDENVKKAIYNYYYERKALKDYYDLKEQVTYEAYDVYQMIDDKKRNVERAIANVAKTMLADSHHMKEMTEIRRQKALLRSVYKYANDK